MAEVKERAGKDTHSTPEPKGVEVFAFVSHLLIVMI